MAPLVRASGDHSASHGRRSAMSVHGNSQNSSTTGMPSARAAVVKVTYLGLHFVVRMKARTTRRRRPRRSATSRTIDTATPRTSADRRPQNVRARTVVPVVSVSYTHLRAHETDSYLVCRLLLEKKK